MNFEFGCFGGRGCMQKLEDDPSGVYILGEGDGDSHVDSMNGRCDSDMLVIRIRDTINH